MIVGSSRPTAVTGTAAARKRVRDRDGRIHSADSDRRRKDGVHEVA